ncbi:ATP-grasp domain-containing protein [Enterococcus sp.]|uniref:ATP-grasp domain-containing protein n=1 Tax=Enterococcus sp. TaxID=35783 RepID=UPI0028A11891|nr:ATP-grasp domain-containing protein [Enterococcus sp.]
MNKTIVLIESQLFYYGYKVIDSLKKAGYNVVLVCRDLSIYVNPFSKIQSQPLLSADFILKVETNCFEELSKKLLDVNKIYPISCIVTFSDYYLEITAKLCEFFELRGNSLESICSTKNKASQYLKVSNKGIIIPKTDVINLSIDKYIKKEKIDYPVIIKPVSSSGSHLVKKISTYNEYKRYIQTLKHIETNERGQPFVKKYLVQEFIEGREYSVEIFVENSNIHILGFTSKELYSEDIFAEKLFSFPCNDRGLYKPSTIKSINKVVNSLGIKYGCLHIEFKLTSDLKFVLIEANPRLGGRYISRMIKDVTGFDCFFESILLLLQGENYVFPTLKKFDKGAAYNVLYPNNDRKNRNINLKNLNINNSIEIFFVDQEKIRSTIDNSDAIGYIYNFNSSALQALNVVRKVEQKIYD